MARLKTDLRARGDGGRKAKAVVFSQFVTFIDIAQKSVEAAGFRCVRLTGGVSAAGREKCIREFQNPDADSPDVIFVSLKAGGVGINLTAASFVYMLDPWWNPATEDQAMDRVPELGQDRPVKVVRFVCKDSIDEEDDGAPAAQEGAGQGCVREEDGEGEAGDKGGPQPPPQPHEFGLRKTHDYDEVQTITGLGS